jgi:hypothetical protein
MVIKMPSLITTKGALHQQAFWNSEEYDKENKGNGGPCLPKHNSFWNNGTKDFFCRAIEHCECQ